MNSKQSIIILKENVLFIDSKVSVNWQNQLENSRILESNCREYDTLFESNCACATPSPFSHGTPAIVNQQTTLQWAGYTRPLADNYHLCFDIKGEEDGAVVVNEAAFRLLQQFRTPQSIAATLKSTKQPDDTQAAVKHLAQIGLLKPTASIHKQPNTTVNTLTAWLHVTNDCNLRCTYCYVDKTPDKMELDRGYQSVEAVFRSAVSQKFKRVKLKYAGGEATMNFPTVIALHHHAQQLASQYGLALDGVVLSNGVAISDRMIVAMKEMGLRLMVSLDGVGEYHDGQRPFVNGRGSFLHLERTLDRLAKHHFTPSISITISQHNLNGLAEVVAFVLERNLPFTLNFSVTMTHVAPLLLISIMKKINLFRLCWTLSRSSKTTYLLIVCLGIC